MTGDIVRAIPLPNVPEIPWDYPKFWDDAWISLQAELTRDEYARAKLPGFVNSATSLETAQTVLFWGRQVEDQLVQGVMPLFLFERHRDFSVVGHDVIGLTNDLNKLEFALAKERLERSEGPSLERLRTFRRAAHARVCTRFRIFSTCAREALRKKGVRVIANAPSPVSWDRGISTAQLEAAFQLFCSSDFRVQHGIRPSRPGNHVVARILIGALLVIGSGAAMLVSRADSPHAF
ncbi:MAG: hypothetical protein HYT76_02985 [Deltaproteobacteria bacterium]|nr:hypothetical protein [Deltaproteobacteria bacterium]